MPDVSLVILAWNRWELTQRCLDTLRSTDLSGANVIVVDNGSTDETPKRLKEYPWVEVMTSPKNLGYVRGNNLALSAIPNGDVVLLNNDLAFTQRDWLQSLRTTSLSAPDIGVVGPRLITSDGKLLHAGTFILPDTMWGQQIGSLETDIGQFSGTRDVEGIVFACAYLRRPLIDKIGFLSEDFVSYFEDTDYCLRARAAGYRVVLSGDVTIVHDEHGSSGGDTEHLSSLFQRSRAVFTRKWSSALENRYRTKLRWQSIMNFPSGYAMSCREILRALDRRDVHVAYEYVYGPGTVFPVPEPEQCDDYLMNVLRARQVEDDRIGVVYGQGDVFERGRGRRRIGFTMLEVNGFPREWVRQANAMDEVWVPTTFNREGFLNSGLKRPIRTIPLGVDTDRFHPFAKGCPNPFGEYVFLSSFEWGERKDPALLLKTFNDEFNAAEPVRLVCKIMNRDPGVHVRDEIRRLGLRETGGRISFLFNLEFPYYQLPAFYRSGNCFVSAGRGEGWDMPLMEAMACGLPSIATDWGAHTEFVHDGIAFPLRVRGLVPAEAKCPYYDGFSWADPDPEHLRHLLRFVYTQRDQSKALGLRAAAEVAARWSWDAAAEKIQNAIQEHAGARPARAVRSA